MSLAKIFYGNDMDYLLWHALTKITKGFNDLNIPDNIETSRIIEMLPKSFLFVSPKDSTSLKIEKLEIIKDHCVTSFSNEKVCLIHNIDKGTVSFQNGLLKLLEESKNTSFYMTSSTQTRVLKTILSRSISQMVTKKPNDELDRIKLVGESYKVEISREEISKIQVDLMDMGFIWLASKSSSKELPKIILVWENHLLQNLDSENHERRSKISHNLYYCDHFLNKWANGVLSKTALEMYFFSNIVRL